ncbi:MAG: adenylate/guanylate cyclase domain-containing protein [Bdellovibrionota bacterium]
MKDKAPLHPVTLRFREKPLEEEFQEDLSSGMRRHFAAVMIVWLLAWLGFAAGDVWIYPEHYEIMWRYRFVLLPVFVLLALFGFAPDRLFKRYWRIPIVALVLTACLGIAAMQVALPWISENAFFGVALIDLALYTTVQAGFVLASGTAFLTVLLYEIALAASGDPMMAVVNNTAWLVAANLLGAFGCYTIELYQRQAFYESKLVTLERARSERLLLNILPAPIASRLKKGEETIADGFEEITVLFSDIVGFTSLSQKVKPAEIVHILNRIFSRFDEIAEKHGLEKIKTIGDAYMVVGGVPEPRPDHAEAVAGMALEMVEAIDAFGDGLQMRIGIHTGPVVAGVIGKKKYSYDLWGDTVNTASRMESHGIPGRVQISEATRRKLGDRFAVEPRGEIEVKGKGRLTTYLLAGKNNPTSS